jgi:hypothetical protein
MLPDPVHLMVGVCGFPNRPQKLQNPAKPGQARAKSIKQKGLKFLGFPSPN